MAELGGRGKAEPRERPSPETDEESVLLEPEEGSGSRDPKGLVAKEAQAEAGAVERDSKETKGTDYEVPERISKALEVASAFEDFRAGRVFRYLHLYAGPKDVLGDAIKTEAAKHRLEVEVIAFDRKVDPSVDLSSAETQAKVLEGVVAGEWDGVHAGFPCGSFSRARHNPRPNMPGPVRDAANIYGFPGNRPRQQQEADRGTLMASQAAWIMKEQVMSMKRRKVPEIATLENPPGDANAGSAWLLPEVKAAMGEVMASMVDYDTCAFMKGHERYRKPGRWGGKLEGLRHLNRVCRCPAWVKHISLVGTDLTEPAAEYPEEMCRIVAEKVVASWKRIVKLEWLRYEMNHKEGVINDLNLKWVVNEEKRRKRIYEALPERGTTLDKGNLEEDNLPSSSGGPTKKQKKETENRWAVGGLRNPAEAVRRLGLVRALGKKIREAWETVFDYWPEARVLAEKYGTTEATFDEGVAQTWKEVLEHTCGAVEPDGIHLKENLEFKSPLNAKLWEGWQRASKDPDDCIAVFAREGVPMGMEVDIPSSNGVFPEVGDEGERADSTVTEFREVQGMLNYTSVTTQQGEASIELDRYVEKGFAKRRSWKEVEAKYGAGTCSKMALILKEKEDGSTKRRLVIDLKRSQGNARCKVNERIILPRLDDVVKMAQDIYGRKDELAAILRARGMKETVSEEARGMEFVLVDLADAFCHFGVNPREYRHCVAPDEKGEGVLVFVAMLFGFRAAPLLMGRLGAAAARLTQSMYDPSELQLQLYVDDLIALLRGPKAHRDMLLSGLLYTLNAFGIQVSLKKGERGSKVGWIGASLELVVEEQQEACIHVGIQRKMLDEIVAKIRGWKNQGMIPIKDLRSLSGKLSWVAGAVPRLRWVATIFYGVLAAAEREEKAGVEAARAAKRADSRPKTGLVALKRLAGAHTWVEKLLEAPELVMHRQVELRKVVATRGVITDASPKGLGGLLVTLKRDGSSFEIDECFEARVTEKEARLLGVEYGEPSSQSTMEALAIWRAILKWGPKLRGQPVLIRGDSSVALAMLKKMASTYPPLNCIASEISLLLEKLRIPRLVLHHLPGKKNVEADWLSRREEHAWDEGLPATIRGKKYYRLSPLQEKHFAMAPAGVASYKGSLPTQGLGIFQSL